MADKAKATYAKPSSQLDLEERLANGNASFRELSTSPTAPGVAPEDGRTYAVEGNDLTGYLGVSAEYATYANETDKPLDGEGPEQEVIDKFREDQEALNNLVVAEEPDTGSEPASKSSAKKSDAPFDSKSSS